MFSSLPVAVLGLIRVRLGLVTSRGPPYPSRSPRRLLVSYRPLAQDHIFANLLRFVALRALDQRGSPVLWPLSLRFLLSDAPRRARNARETPRFGQGFHAALYLRAEETTVDYVRSVRALSVGLNNVAQSPIIKRARVF